MTGTNFNSRGGTQANNVNNGSGSQNNNNGSGMQNNWTGPDATVNNNNGDGKSSPGGSQGRNHRQDEGGYLRGNGISTWHSQSVFATMFEPYDQCPSNEDINLRIHCQEECGDE
ncbi:hypothetical protein BO85DRAFT_476670 [Aspergillus piperis CBS 112811]|uniref:Uncharacterized protein n=1 Tax=Aspergillus piperis CBS 112811 TaxID=1448313 RepID=A0A8G1VNU4_9EURO|nr:hypothetical protein BO85DRAFT_476670 [Aspergillus piperis CBS 112811]RAH58942.1 hypothetical protein BO85DRAFT_476670 [Aspergillus piperis CBS 112811]